MYVFCRCEHTLTNSVTEACALTTAARSFAAANESLSELHLPQFAENLHAAINCFSHAIRVSHNQLLFSCCAAILRGCITELICFCLFVYLSVPYKL